VSDGVVLSMADFLLRKQEREGRNSHFLLGNENENGINYNQSGAECTPEGREGLHSETVE
jgi:hypothetical protein